ncbi:peptidoglycan DD-metalloendopeptidase family protein [Kangiella sp. TOML190]|uniref:peptidoglycan DD-metalloendopeptidase family protein n=1 Tax=Kangiella sp. TOML190 TaxID=2931351 RepID=UPI0020417550|nr:peptidoglycan DD-metalloendopeptidase family protein [Kangiella sp. TOML190]
MQKEPPKPLSKILKQSAVRALWLVAIVFAVYLLQGCGNERLASVEERHTKKSNVVANKDRDYSAVDAQISRYQVKAGDTLYSIAFRFGLDYRDLAKANGIGSSYFIRIGQWLDIDKARDYQARDSQAASEQVAANSASPISRRTKVDSSSAKPQTASAASKPQIKPSTKPNQKPVNKPKVVDSTNPPKKPTAGKPATKPATKPAVKPRVVKADPNRPVKFWIWPNMGRVIKSFRGSGNKGIDIEGNIGDTVRASAAGRVVYAGRGLRGYGNLVIIKHNESFISAYAHNRRILVKENEIIKAGQKIAEMGNSDAEQPKLHFEIRYKGKPTDPMRYLPKR